MRQKGVLQSWHKNGYGMVSVDEELFFLHRNNIAYGEPIVGSLVEFNVAPARGKGKFPQAVAAQIVTPALAPAELNCSALKGEQSPLAALSAIDRYVQENPSKVLTPNEQKTMLVRPIVRWEGVK